MKKKNLSCNFFLYLLLLVLTQCNGRSESGQSLQQIKDLKTRQYAIEGRVLYEAHCSNCHQKDGTGLGKLIPPLANADFLQESIGRTIRIIKFGMEGEIMVNGITYNQPMPGNPQLTNLEIAEIATYIYNIWGNDKGLISTDEVNQYLLNE